MIYMTQGSKKKKKKKNPTKKYHRRAKTNVSFGYPANQPTRRNVTHANWQKPSSFVASAGVRRV